MPDAGFEELCISSDKLLQGYIGPRIEETTQATKNRNQFYARDA